MPSHQNMFFSRFGSRSPLKFTAKFSIKRLEQTSPTAKKRCVSVNGHRITNLVSGSRKQTRASQR